MPPTIRHLCSRSLPQRTAEGTVSSSNENRLPGRCLETLLLAISELRRKLGRVSNLNWSISWHHHIKGHVEIGYLTKFGALKLNGDQVMTLETWIEIHTNVCNFATATALYIPPHGKRKPGRQRTLFLRYIQHLLGDTDNMIGPGKLSELAQDRCG